MRCPEECPDLDLLGFLIYTRGYKCGLYLIQVSSLEEVLVDKQYDSVLMVVFLNR